MKVRLSLDERNEIAFKLRSHILSIENPKLLESLSDQRFQPHNLVLGSYAFEFFIERFRDRFRESSGDSIAYNIGWSKGALRRDEEKLHPNHKVIRLSVSLLMTDAEDRGQIKKATNEWYKVLSKQKAPIGKDQLGLFLYEIAYELAVEFTRDLADKLK